MDHVFDIHSIILSIVLDAGHEKNKEKGIHMSRQSKETIGVTLVPPNNRPSSVDNDVCKR